MLPGGEALPETEEDVSESDIDGQGRHYDLPSQVPSPTAIRQCPPEADFEVDAHRR